MGRAQPERLQAEVRRELPLEVMDPSLLEEVVTVNKRKEVTITDRRSGDEQTGICGGPDLLWRESGVLKGSVEISREYEDGSTRSRIPIQVIHQIIPTPILRLVEPPKGS